MKRYTDTISGEELYLNIDEDYNKFYYKDKAMKIRHRLDGPAVEDAYGGKAWFVDGKRHRQDGPAVEYTDGGKEWFVDGKRHRLDGPAVKYADGGKYWVVNDVLIMRLDKDGKIEERME